MGDLVLTADPLVLLFGAGASGRARFLPEPGSSAAAIHDQPAESTGSNAQQVSLPSDAKLFIEGDALYAAMLASIRSASRTVRMESYIFASDEVGREFAAALTERALAGIDVRLHLDAAAAFGSFASSLLRAAHTAGVQLKWFHRWSWRSPLRYNRRNHRKLLVVDEAIAYVGGFNVHRLSSRHFFGEARWRDSHAALTGALVQIAARLFDAFWHGDLRWTPSEADSAGLISNHTRACRHRIRCLYAEAFAEARDRICLTTPYFVPDLLMQQRLMAAARRGVDVRLLVPSRSDVPVTRWAAHAFYAALIEAGVRIYEYLPRMLHAKTVSIDGEWAVLGTSNFDYRSFFLNYELVFMTREPGFCKRLEQGFEADLGESIEVTAERWAQRRWPRRVLEGIGWTLRRWL